MLVDKRTLLVGVTFEADRILRGRSSYLLGTDRTVYVVAIAALNQSFVHSVMKWHFELGFLLKVAPVAELGLSLYQQELRLGRVVRRMAGNTTDVILRVQRVDGIHVLRAACVTGQAALVDVLC